VTLPKEDKDRKALPIWTGCMMYFPDVWAEIAKVSKIGNDQHNPGQPLHWAREKSTDQMNTAFRHMLDHGAGNLFDVNGEYHLAKAIWRLCAELQLTIEKQPKMISVEEAGYIVKNTHPAAWCTCGGKSCGVETLNQGDEVWYCPKCRGLTRVKYNMKAEKAAGVQPQNPGFPPGDVRRYGATSDDEVVVFLCTAQNNSRRPFRVRRSDIYLNACGECGGVVMKAGAILKETI
jgi:Zn-finger nucleic acid-binding protein